MTKLTPILERCILCPKCQLKTMRKSLNSKQVFGSEFGREYFCDHCHLYFGINELVNQWNYDAGDFGDISKETFVYISCMVAHNKLKNTPIILDLEKWEKLARVEDKLVSTNWFDTVSTFQIDEPQFKSVKERDEAYEMVDRMFLDIPEWSEGCGNVGIDIGVVGVPV